MAEIKLSPFGDPPAPQQPQKRSPFGDPPATQQPPPPPSVGEDVLRSIPSSLRKGVETLVSFPAEVNEMTSSGVARIARALFGDQIAEQAGEYVPEGFQEGISAERVREATNKVAGGEPYEPQTTAGRYTSAVGEQVPGVALGPGRWLTKALMALLAGGGSEGARDLAEGTGYEDAAAAAGGLAGAFAGGRAFRPGQTTREAARDAQIATLDREGVPMTAGQRTGSKRLQYLESEVGGDAFDRIIDRQRSVFTDAAMRRIGEAGGAALPEDLARARARIGGEFDRLSAQAVVPFDAQLQNNLLQTAADYQEVAPQIAPVVENLMNRMGQQAARNGGMMTGEQYQAMSSELRRLAGGADEQVGNALNAFRDALDDAVERTLTGPALAEWQAARRQYANLMTIERSMTGGGVEQASGMVSPVRLRTAISGGGQGPAAIAEGRSNLTELANAGVGVTKDLPQSGTASRQAARGVPAAAVGIGTGVATGDPTMGGVAALASAIAPKMIGGVVMNPASQYLLGRGGMTEDQRLALASILAGRVGWEGGQP